MDNDILLLLARALSKKGVLSQSQLSSLFSPELGYLTGTTWEDTGASGENEDLLKMQYAPNLRLVENLPDTDIRKRIARMIVVDGIAPWDVKATIEEYAAAQANANPETYNAEGETSDLMSFADTIFKENNALNVQSAKSAGVESDWSKKTGKLAPFTARYSAAELAPDYFSALAEQLMKGQEEMRKIQAPGARTLRSASKFVEQQNQEVNKLRTQKPWSGTAKATSGATLVTEGQLAPYVPAGAAKTVSALRSGSTSRDPEMARFADVAKSIVARGPQNKELSAQRADLLKRQQIMEKVGQDFAMKLEQTAEQLGFTPAMVDLLKRVQFLRVGGK